MDSVIIDPRAAEAATEEFAKSVALGLTDTPPWLHSRFLYDDEGSRLFEEISKQPEYYLTSAEAEILKRCASRICDATGPVALIELGSGNSVKTDAAELVASVSPDAPASDVDSVIIDPRAAEAATEEFAKSVALGLTDTPPWLHSRFLYDDEGSRLFEEISKQPEYYLTSAEAEILKRCASRICDATGPVALIELGSGNSVKTDHLLSAYAAAESSVRYVPVDVSGGLGGRG